MAIRTVKLNLTNDKGEELTFESMNLSDDPTHPKEFSALILEIMKQVGQAATVHPGFIDWDEA